jgi:hypothetical protein
MRGIGLSFGGGVYLTLGRRYEVDLDHGAQRIRTQRIVRGTTLRGIGRAGKAVAMLKAWLARHPRWRFRFAPHLAYMG